MKKIFPYLMGFIIGGLIFGSIGVVAYTYKADQITYNPSDTSWNVNNVKDAIDGLYTKAKPEYTGSTTITPTTSNQVIATGNKILTSDITINAIPSTYKNLTTPTDVNTNNLLSGIKAYTSDGTLVTGSLSTDCVSGIKIVSTDITSGMELVNFVPNTIFTHIITNAGSNINYYYNNVVDSTNIAQYSKKTDSVTINTLPFSDRFIINNSKLYIYNSGASSWAGLSLYYMACK